MTISIKSASSDNLPAQSNHIALLNHQKMLETEKHQPNQSPLDKIEPVKKLTHSLSLEPIEAAANLGLRRLSENSAMMRLKHLDAADMEQLAHHMQLNLRLGQAVDPEKMNAGYTNVVFGVTYNQTPAIIRFPCSNANAHCVNRSFEKEVISLASEAGIAPETYYINTQGLVCSKRLDQDPHPPKEALLKQLIPVLQNLYKLPIKQSNHSVQALYTGWINTVHRLYEAKELPAGFDQVCHSIMSSFNDLEIQRLPQGVCHLDLHDENIISANDRLFLIDFETACMGSQLFDVASMTHSMALDEDQEKKLLQALKPDSIQPDEWILGYKTIKRIYALRSILWLLIQAKTVDTQTNQCDHTSLAVEKLNRLDEICEAMKPFHSPAALIG